VLLGGVKYTLTFNLTHKARATKLAQELQKEAETLQVPLQFTALKSYGNSEMGGKKSTVLPSTIFFFQVLFAGHFRDVLGGGFKYVLRFSSRFFGK